MSLANKLSLYIALLIISIFCAIGAVYLRYGVQREERLMSLYAGLMVENSVERLDGEFSRVEEDLIVSAPVALNVLERPAALSELVSHIVRGDSLIMGGSVALRPGVITGRRDSLYMVYVCRDKDGGWQRKELGDSSYNYTLMGWYRDAVNARHAVWSDPYFDRGGGNEMMVTCSYPLRDSGDNFVGVLTADISLKTLSDVVARLRPIDDSYAFILSDKGMIVAHPDQRLVLHKSIFDYSRETGCGHLAAIGREMLAHKKGTRHMDVAGEDALVVYEPIPGTGWSICSVCPYKSVMSRLDLIAVKAVVLLLLGLAIMLVLVRLVIVYSMKKLVRLTDAAVQISAGDLNVDLPEMKPSDDISRLNNAFCGMQQSLRRQMRQFVETTRAKEHIESELHIARSIQMSLVPHTFSPFLECRGLELYACIRPAKEVGGDLYDFFISDNKLYFTIGDVSGKGVPASLFMAVARTLFRSTAARSDSPAAILSTINDTILKDNDACMFVTMFVGVLDLGSGMLTFCNAGHNRPVLVGPEGAAMLEVKENIPVGVMDGFDYEEERMQLRADLKLFIYTDGLTEAENAAKELYGDDRMLAFLSTTAGDTPRRTITRAEESVDGFAGGVDQSDDLTMLCLRLDNSRDYTHRTTFPNSLSIVEKLPAFIGNLASLLNLGKETCGRINLILEETLVNVVSYAYPHGVTGEIEVTTRYGENTGGLTFEISDRGVAFDPTAAPDPDIDAPADERPIGGLGIHMVRTLADRVEYRRDGNRNILTITLLINQH